MRSERRKYTRFLAEKDAYAALGINFERVGRLKDISFGGLAFEYIDCTGNCVMDSSRVTIFHSRNEFHLPNLACSLICSSAIYPEYKDQHVNRQYVIHRCAVQFGYIDAQQCKQLEFFIDNYTCGTAGLYPVITISGK